MHFTPALVTSGSIISDQYCGNIWRTEQSLNTISTLLDEITKNPGIES
jgi:hypothetical protein